MISLAHLVGPDGSEFFVDIVEPIRHVLAFPLLELRLQLFQLGQQLRSLDVGRQDGLERRSVVGDDLLLAVEDVDVRRNLKRAVSDVTKQRRFAVTVGTDETVP